MRAPKKFSFGFIIDPLESFDREAETTLFLMRELYARKHRIFAIEPKNLFLKQNEVWGVADELHLTDDPQYFYQIKKNGTVALKTLDLVFLRKDPPFDLRYLEHLYLLAKLERHVPMINAPTSILKWSEKLVPLDFPYSPKTFVSARCDLILEWGKQFSKGIVVKPIGDGGGRGVERLEDLKSAKSRDLIKRLTENQIKMIVCQEFRPEVKEGDKRILIWNGKILGSFLRKPKAGEFRANLHQGGKFIPCKLTPEQKKRAMHIARWCKKEKNYFVGLDMIGDWVTEINLTSPMGIREVNALYNLKCEKIIADDVLKMC